MSMYVQEKLHREEEELKREKERLIEEREAQRLQRYVSPSVGGSSGRGTMTDVDRYPRGSTVSEDSAASRVMRNDEVVDRQRGYVKGEPVMPEKARFPAVDDGRSRTLASDTAMPRSYQHQQSGSGPSRENPSYQYPMPVQSQQQQQQQRPSFSVPATSYQPVRQSDGLQFAGARTPREETVVDPHRQLSASLDGNEPRWTPSADVRVDARRGAPHQREMTAHDHGRPQGHWRMSSYEYADGRKNARDYSRAEPTPGGRMAPEVVPSNAVQPRGHGVPARDDRGASTFSSQPDLLRYHEQPTHAPRPAVEPPRRSAEP